MSIVGTALNTLYKPEFYRELKEKSLKNTIGYFTKLALVCALFGGILAAVFVSPIVFKVLADLQSEVTAYYPPDLEITIEKGIASTNAKSEPIFFPIKDNWKQVVGNNTITKSPDNKTLENIFVLNTKAQNEVTPDSFKNMNTYSLLTQKNFISYDSSHNIVIKDLSQFGDTKINKDVIARLFALARFIPPTLPVIYFLLSFISIFSTLISLIGVAFLFFLIQYVTKYHISFKDSYKTVVYASSIPIFLSILFFLAGIPISGILTLLFLMTLLVAIINTKRENVEVLG